MYIFRCGNPGFEIDELYKSLNCCLAKRRETETSHANPIPLRSFIYLLLRMLKFVDFSVMYATTCQLNSKHIFNNQLSFPHHRFHYSMIIIMTLK